MNIKFLGTAAAEGVPALFCQCDVCKIAKEEKGRNIRTRFQISVNDDLLIDFPPDTYMHVINQELNLDTVKDILITHSHEDHIFIPDLSYRMDGYSGKRPDGKINIYSNPEVYKMIDDYIESVGIKSGFNDVFETKNIEPFQKYNIGKYTVYALSADHNPPEHCYFYIVIDEKGKAALFAHDTGYFPQSSWKFLEQLNLQFDLISLDCTCAFLDSDRMHMSMNVCSKVKNRLIDMNCTHDKTVFIVDHFSHNGLKGNFETLEKLAEQSEFIPAYDGMEIQI